jgi:rubrerythrin
MNEKEIKILKTAILNEVEGETFYILAANNSKSPDIKEALEILASDEKKHQEALKKMLANMTEGQDNAVDINQLGVVSPGIFKLQQAKRVVDNLEITVISTAILMEKASMDFYRQAASQTSDSNAQELFAHLADWEMEHLDSLQKAYDYLEEDWFDQQHFSPA